MGECAAAQGRGHPVSMTGLGVPQIKGSSCTNQRGRSARCGEGRGLALLAASGQRWPYEPLNSRRLDSRRLGLRPVGRLGVLVADLVGLAFFLRTSLLFGWT